MENQMVAEGGAGGEEKKVYSLLNKKKRLAQIINIKGHDAQKFRWQYMRENMCDISVSPPSLVMNHFQ